MFILKEIARVIALAVFDEIKIIYKKFQRKRKTSKIHEAYENKDDKSINDIINK